MELKEINFIPASFPAAAAKVIFFFSPAACVLKRKFVGAQKA
jgi:hypothetical protein